MRVRGGVAYRDQSGTGLAARTLRTIVLVALAGLALAVPAAAKASHPPWTIQHTLNATVRGGQIQSVSCSSSVACTAVGSAVGRSGINVTLAERWNGTSWSLQRAANLASETVPGYSPELFGVSCPTARFCEGVGSYQLNPSGVSLAERWNGNTWAIQAFPVPRSSTYAGLSKVSCASDRFCEAVGYYGDVLGLRLPFAAKWNGTSWKLQRMPAPAEASFNNPGGVSCVSSSFCEATEDSDAGPFALRWNGASWHFQHVPGQGVASVSCVSPSFCEAASAAGSDEWNGSSWTAQQIQAPAGSTF